MVGSGAAVAGGWPRPHTIAAMVFAVQNIQRGDRFESSGFTSLASCLSPSASNDRKNSLSWISSGYAAIKACQKALPRSGVNAPKRTQSFGVHPNEYALIEDDDDRCAYKPNRHCLSD